MTSIPLCTLRDGGYKHVWRFVTMIPQIATDSYRGLWQCNDCHRIEEGRPPTPEELRLGTPVVVQDLKVPT